MFGIGSDVLLISSPLMGVGSEGEDPFGIGLMILSGLQAFCGCERVAEHFSVGFTVKTGMLRLSRLGAQAPRIKPLRQSSPDRAKLIILYSFGDESIAGIAVRSVCRTYAG